MSNHDELAAIRERYERRAFLPADRYSPFKPEVIAAVQQRQRATINVLKAKGIRSLKNLDVFEIGCGTGANLLEFLLLGATPERLAGNDMLPDRLHLARNLLPEAVRLLPGDAPGLVMGDDSLDFVYQSTLFSSILDDALQARIANNLWRWVRPGGAVLWYDFTYNNPSNPDVRGVPLRRVKELFPHALITTRRVTLAPPLARRVAPIHPALYTLFNTIPLLRTHILCWIEKP